MKKFSSIFLICSCLSSVSIAGVLNDRDLLVSCGSGAESKILRFDRFGFFEEVLVAPNGSLRGPHGMYLTPEPLLRLQVANFGGGDIQTYNTTNGTMTATLIAKDLGRLEAPTQIRRWRNEWWVCDYRGGAVRRYTDDGTNHLGNFVPPGYFGTSLPSDMIFPTGTDEALYVCNSGNSFVSAFELDPGFNIARNPRVFSQGNELIMPRGIAIVQNKILVTDSLNNRVLKYGDAGLYEGVFAEENLSYPNGIAIDPTSGDVYVASTGSNNVRKYRFDGTALGVAATGNGLTSPNGVLVVRRGVVNLKITTTLQDWTGTYNAFANFHLKREGRPVEELDSNVILESGAEYTFGTRNRGSYNLYVKASHWLRKRVGPIEITNDGVNNIAVTLINGDVNRDNEIDLMDVMDLVAAFGTSGGDPGFTLDADLNGDEEVSLVDYAIVAKNFGLHGDDF